MWTYNGKELTDEDIDGHVGFVYLIENLTNGKKYIGKKLFCFTRTKKVKGRRKKTKIESDWRTYWGSNDSLLYDVASLGEENFRRTILKLCKTKGTANYYEAKFQMQYECLESDCWYNDQIRLRVHRSHIKH